jgi:hypothetical protein
MDARRTQQDRELDRSAKRDDEERRPERDARNAVKRAPKQAGKKGGEARQELLRDLASLGPETIVRALNVSRTLATISLLIRRLPASTFHDPPRARPVPWLRPGVQVDHLQRDDGGAATRSGVPDLCLLDGLSRRFGPYASAPLLQIEQQRQPTIELQPLVDSV